MPPIVLFGLQFTLALIAWALLAAWYVVPRLAPLPQHEALIAPLWVHVFRVGGGVLLAPGSVDAAVPADFRAMVGYGDMLTGLLALIAVVALRVRSPAGVGLAWLAIVVGTLDTANAVAQSMRYSVFDLPLGINWSIVTLYVPALLVSSVLVFWRLLRPAPAAASA